MSYPQDTVKHMSADFLAELNDECIPFENSNKRLNCLHQTFLIQQSLFVIWTYDNMDQQKKNIYFHLLQKTHVSVEYAGSFTLSLGHKR